MMKHLFDLASLRGRARQLVVALALAVIAGFLPLTMGLAFLGVTGAATWKATHAHEHP
jgi:hypothetical protein